MKLTVAKAIVRFLEQAGVEIAAGYNGHGNWALLDAVEHESKIRGIKTNAEDAAVHLADGYWRVRRRPPLPVVFTTVGPGNMNICAALANAFYESSAMLIIAGAGPTQWFDKGCFEECYRYGPEEFTRVVKPICKKAALVTRPDTALETVVRAYKEAVSGRPGPVLVQIPFDIQHTEIEIESIPEAVPWTHIHPPGPSPVALDKAAGLIKESVRPLILVGSGIHNALAHDALRVFAEEFQIPVGTSFSGKGALSEAHPLSLGVLDPSGTGQGFRAARECDLLIGVGVRFHDFNTLAWNMYPIPESTKLVHIDVDPIELSRNYPSEVAMIADGRLALEGLARTARKERVDPEKHKPWLDELAVWRKEWLAQIDGPGNLGPVRYGQPALVRARFLLRPLPVRGYEQRALRAHGLGLCRRARGKPRQPGAPDRLDRWRRVLHDVRAVDNDRTRIRNSGYLGGPEQSNDRDRTRSDGCNLWKVVVLRHADPEDR